MKFKPVSSYIQVLIDALAIYLNGAEVSVIGISRGGFWVAKQVCAALDNATELGELDISFYRDDFSTLGLHPQVKPSNIKFAVEAQHIVLIDDIIRTGRTIRAALNEIFDFGRPAKVTLACLFELSGRELPIRADVVAEQFSLPLNQQIKLQGPENLSLQLISLEPSV